MSEATLSDDLPAGHRVGRYTVVRVLGRGGMGVVYVARDDRLERDIALKMIAGLSDPVAVRRFWREARAAASVNHPNVCQVFEVDESGDGIYLAMELLSGESLETRLERGALSPEQAASVAIATLAALGALHERGLIHRDVKPSNVFLSAHGPKLLDFGLARASEAQTVPPGGDARTEATHGGVAVGTPRYMSPEQLSAEALDYRTDLYSLGAVLFEMVAGRPPFVGRTVVDLMYATLHERPPALQGPPEVVAIDRVIRRAMEKDPRDRFATAAEMGAELRAIRFASTDASPVIAVRALTRIVVPPLLLVRPDPDISFLSFGLAESISGTLASLGDVVVRAPSVAATWTTEHRDPRELAVEADVELVLSGSLTRSGEHLRAVVQLLDASAGTVISAANVTGALAEIFEFEDRLAQTATQLLTAHRSGGAPVTPVQAHAPRDVPASAHAFELFLRGTEHARLMEQMASARDDFLEAVREDPVFAPAWAALGRCHRVIGKFVGDRVENERKAEDAFRRALALSPNLPMAHRYLTHLESEQGRADAAVSRLLEHAKFNRNDAQIFAGLVHACRYGGLIEESLAAHREARRLDPTVPTSVEYTYLQTVRDVAELARLTSELKSGAEPDVTLLMMVMQGTEAQVRAEVGRLNLDSIPPIYRLTVEAVAAAALEPREVALELIQRGVDALADPEALFLFSIALVRLGERERAVELMGRVVAGGFAPVAMLRNHSYFAPLRDIGTFGAIVADADRRVQTAKAVFDRGRGRALLGLATTD